LKAELAILTAAITSIILCA